jgi:hypothetical protein
VFKEDCSETVERMEFFGMVIFLSPIL